MRDRSGAARARATATTLCLAATAVAATSLALAALVSYSASACEVPAPADRNSTRTDPPPIFVRTLGDSCAPLPVFALVVVAVAGLWSMLTVLSTCVWLVCVRTSGRRAHPDGGLWGTFATAVGASYANLGDGGAPDQDGTARLVLGGNVEEGGTGNGSGDDDDGDGNDVSAEAVTHAPSDRGATAGMFIPSTRNERWRTNSSASFHAEHAARASSNAVASDDCVDTHFADSTDV